MHIREIKPTDALVKMFLLFRLRFVSSAVQMQV
jgi:hypothetical protein